MLSLGKRLDNMSTTEDKKNVKVLKIGTQGVCFTKAFLQYVNTFKMFLYLEESYKSMTVILVKFESSRRKITVITSKPEDENVSRCSRIPKVTVNLRCL